VTTGPGTALGRSLIALVAAVAVLASLGASDGGAPSTPSGGGAPSTTTDRGAASTTTGGQIVLVSGRDDHGQHVADRLPLHDRPDGVEVTTIAADTLAAVQARSGTWLLVAGLEGEPSEGWIDEFLVRGELHVVSPDTPACPVPTDEGLLPASARVRVSDVHRAGVGATRIGVVTVADGTEHHVERARLRELPGPANDAGTGCGDVRELRDPVHRH
jgi:hypothetical protein